MSNKHQTSPFNLEAAMRGEPLVTRKGYRAFFVDYSPRALQSCNVLSYRPSGYPRCQFTDSNGRIYSRSEGAEDLMMSEKKLARKFRTDPVWIRVCIPENRMSMPRAMASTQREAVIDGFEMFRGGFGSQKLIADKLIRLDFLPCGKSRAEIVSEWNHDSQPA